MPSTCPCRNPFHLPYELVTIIIPIVQKRKQWPGEIKELAQG